MPSRSIASLVLVAALCETTGRALDDEAVLLAFAKQKDFLKVLQKDILSKTSQVRAVTRKDERKARETKILIDPSTNTAKMNDTSSSLFSLFFASFPAANDFAISVFLLLRFYYFTVLFSICTAPFLPVFF